MLISTTRTGVPAALAGAWPGRCPAGAWAATLIVGPPSRPCRCRKRCSGARRRHRRADAGRPTKGRPPSSPRSSSPSRPWPTAPVLRAKGRAGRAQGHPRACAAATSRSRTASSSAARAPTTPTAPASAETGKPDGAQLPVPRQRERHPDRNDDQRRTGRRRQRVRPGAAGRRRPAPPAVRRAASAASACAAAASTAATKAT
jgi:hypothetical protein